MSNVYRKTATELSLWKKNLWGGFTTKQRHCGFQGLMGTDFLYSTKKSKWFLTKEWHRIGAPNLLTNHIAQDLGL